jgi:hypothetical protein
MKRKKPKQRSISMFSNSKDASRDLIEFVVSFTWHQI